MESHWLVRLEHCIDVSKCLALRCVAIKSSIYFFFYLTLDWETWIWKQKQNKNHMLKVRIKRTRAQKHIDCNWGVIKAVDEQTNATGKSLILTECASFKRDRHRLSKLKCCCMLMRFGHGESCGHMQDKMEAETTRLIIRWQQMQRVTPIRNFFFYS